MLGEPVTDFRAGEEFARELFARLPLREVEPVVQRLEEKSRRFRSLLSPGAVGQLQADSLAELLRLVFGTRRRAGALLADPGADALRRALEELLYGSGSVDQRFCAFCEYFPEPRREAEAVDLAGEVLHWVDPHRYWLWTRWMWNPRTQTGALRLLVADWRPLVAPTVGEAYLRVGEAVAYAEAARQSLGLFAHAPAGTPSFLTDIYLACVYTLYLFTALRMRMSQEFTKILPGPWELMQRLLGVGGLEV
ncbi:MAG: hypothetical protein QN188_11325 [Armatimonadota bacterium]|nr:hypothetical protein [Armatimonadota bacterium]MDR5675916.1 hypothetical protein [Armatimonadota bacterium]MDR5688891.1 hypothetical protein [Armatimonadota bacterium]MDR7387190.1 hypothetical protein [Armatimonadota bacterium]MDR7390003.1 hypothetical protein [Armatimonadota bacterium]